MPVPTPQKPGVILIIAKGKQTPTDTYNLPDRWSREVSKKLAAFGLRSVEDYHGLYDQNDQLSKQKIDEFLDPKKRKRMCAVRDPQNPGFPDLDLPDDAFRRLVAPLDKKGRFAYRDEHPEADLSGVAPDEIRDLKELVETRLEGLEDKNPSENNGQEKRRKKIIPKDAKDYIENELKGGLKTVAEVFRQKKIVFHQPHHDLTPGILWLDEIFRALVSQVGGLVEEINKTTPPGSPPDLTPLEAFVRKLGHDGGENEFTSVILPGGEQLPGTDHPVDPTRVELFFDGNFIRCAAVIVGAWQGGTHSAGHT